MKILVLGNGGREHAIVKALQKSPRVNEIFNVPGIDAERDTLHNISMQLNDFNSLINLVKKNAIDITIVGPELPLVEGIVDAFQNENLAIFGPDAFAAQLEGSKAFAKSFMKKFAIPTAGYETFNNFNEAVKYIKKCNSYPLVIKASGLAAGKGVIIPATESEALQCLESMFISKEFGKAADEIVIEEFMDGEEASVFAICDGKDYLCLPAAQDHKRIGEGDSGKNTGGMGAYAPAKVVNDVVLAQVKKEIIEKVLFGMEKEGHPYKGVLYCGLMIKDNKAKVVEFNVRFGDPETQVILPLLDSDIVQLLISSINGTIKDYPLQISSDFAMTVVLASKGYPDNYEKNKVISGLESVKNCEIIHSGTILKDKTFLTNGGRVLNVVAKASQAKEVAQLIYDDIKRIHFDGMYFRRDIGHRILK